MKQLFFKKEDPSDSQDFYLQSKNFFFFFFPTKLSRGVISVQKIFGSRMIRALSLLNQLSSSIYCFVCFVSHQNLYTGCI